ncbi:GGDEF domain-containing protein [Mycobacterium sp. 1274761.0]|uniref:GGDEF domain-containing protein n=1 Tax=Mycobacterium sp. 1274761.0 TaxID=1834077 RepID=UPI0007FDF561|nr:GGDEF domain-containing protein [Mycobacterium sp. 1274761.0]OBK78478.1 hypothetical protein A5651_02730 [Mycobacterium sp. 1274761.0]
MRQAEGESTFPLFSWEIASELDRESVFAAVVDSLDEGVVILRMDGNLKYLNPAAMQIYGLRTLREAADFFEQATRSQFYDADGAPVPPERHPRALAYRSGAFSRQLYGVDLPNGKRLWVLMSARLLNRESPFPDVLVSFSDVTAEREDRDRLHHQAHHDPLTGLPNRAFVLRRIAEALESADGGRLRAVLFLDLDDLKATNDMFGHKAGDELLKAAATRLRQCVGPDDVVARHGGDEFVVLIFGDAPEDEICEWRGRLWAQLARPVNIGEATVPIRASIGIVEVDRDERRGAEEILGDADLAMYKAKRSRRRQCR